MDRRLKEMMNSKEMMLINKGDLFLLLHTTVDFFFEHDATEEFVDDTLKALFFRNHYSQEMADDFMKFCELYYRNEANSDLDSETREIALRRGFESVDDFMNYLMVRRVDDTDSETQS